jgi:hypothetical protein
MMIETKTQTLTNYLGIKHNTLKANLTLLFIPLLYDYTKSQIDNSHINDFQTKLTFKL